MKLNGSQPPSPQLLWYDIKKGDEEAGEMLAAFELFLVRTVLLFQRLFVLWSGSVVV